MKRILLFAITSVFAITSLIAQDTELKKEKQASHYNTSKFKQLQELLPTPNKQHTASGAPGYEYTQQQVDYVMDIVLDDENRKLFGKETITYHNNSKDVLEYLWVQLDQNMRAPDSKTPEVSGGGPSVLYSPTKFAGEFMGKPFDGGFKIDYVNDIQNKPLDYMINRTMMRINLPKPLASGEKFVFKIKWWYNINDYTSLRGRSGYEPFPDGNNLYVIAQFFPRLAVYNNVEGWQNMQFWGRSEFALEFGNYQVNITTPKDHTLNATGVVQNPKDVFTKKQYKRYADAKNHFDNPVMIVTPEEAKEAEKGFSTKTKTWKYYAENVRDFAFASSRKFIWDAMAVDINGKTVMAYSLYPNEGNPLWEEHSTRTVANTLKVYSEHTFDYPYPQATSVNAKQQGMEYPMICWNFGRPRNGVYTNRTKKGMIGVITHEVGHNFFPMIVNSDERQWTWMDEGINSFVEILAEYKYDSELFPLEKYPKNIVGYMKGDQSRLSPIMSQGDNVFNFSPNAYSKPAAGLFILRQTIMGPELFDYAFKTYAKRWKFKHPTPADFFRTMEDASAMDLDWFWRGWFYTTGNNDIGIKEVKKYYVTDKPTERAENMAKRYGITADQLPPSLYLVSESSDEFSEELKSKKPEDYTVLSDYIDKNFSSNEKETIKAPKYFYELTFEKPGDLVMPIVVEFEFEDGTKERKQYPAQIWRLNDSEVTKVYPSSKAIKKITIDPDEQTADVDLTNNSWPKNTETKFDKFKKNQIKG
ncbi:M1 family metallopeptidase [Lutibacter sp. TH_r2]|uniref:M1 family metallopeptidase n=1 Tax=Lutibacter sp. TH_r2 TaxID=3082083 RepID=UPI002955903B|nr:M1 family metallopeptidase [Lutibacter sp. TH_r2]MDV7188080.1 M1 family metallopeptidase [Lutibacter sp. TH_r2]